LLKDFDHEAGCIVHHTEQVVVANTCDTIVLSVFYKKNFQLIVKYSDLIKFGSKEINFYRFAVAHFTYTFLH